MPRFGCFHLTGLSPLLGLPLIAALTAALGLLLYRLLFQGQLQPDRAIARIEANSLLLFFGISVILQNLAAVFFTATPRAYRHLDEVYRVGELAMTGSRIASLGVATTILLAVLAFLRHSSFGLSIKALIQHREAARVVGIDVAKVQTISIMLGFGVAGIAGALISLSEQISPFMGFPFTIAAFVVIILGGLGNITGGILAGFLLAAIEIYGVALTSPNARSILLYGIFVAIILLRPEGLLARARR